MKQIRCIDCHNWFEYPEEWLDLKPNDQAYLEDGFLCEQCTIDRDQETYYRCGMAELL